MDFQFMHTEGNGDYNLSKRLSYYADDIQAVIKQLDIIRMGEVIDEPRDEDYYLRLCMLALGSIRDSLEKEAQSIC